MAAAQQLPDRPAEAIATSLPPQCPQQDPSAGDAMPEVAGMDISGMDEAHRASLEGMMKMHPAMLRGMMADDPDVAFVCGMIAHHQGAIDMAQVELEHGDNDEAREMAQKIIDTQMKEIADFTLWLEANAS
ncbi:MAG: DUF305 domain-containing protein [Pseudaminobacter sp.]|nr:DUF305 domain-containing protein [Pseudaminobacter sp.]